MTINNIQIDTRSLTEKQFFKALNIFLNHDKVLCETLNDDPFNKMKRVKTPNHYLRCYSNKDYRHQVALLPKEPSFKLISFSELIHLFNN